MFYLIKYLHALIASHVFNLYNTYFNSYTYESQIT